MTGSLLTGFALFPCITMPYLLMLPNCKFFLLPKPSECSPCDVMGHCRTTNIVKIVAPFQGLQRPHTDHSLTHDLCGLPYCAIDSYNHCKHAKRPSIADNCSRLICVAIDIVSESTNDFVLAYSRVQQGRHLQAPNSKPVFND